MKKIFLLAAFAFAAVSVSAQDIITKKNAEELEVKVVKVGSKEIEYKAWNNQDGPVYTIPCSEVFTIKYQNGRRDVISQMSSGSSRTKQNGKFPRYQGEVALGYALGFDCPDRVVFETVHGVRISPYIFAGLGVGINFLHDIPVYRGNGYIDSTTGLILPVFANVKGYYPVSNKFAVYTSLDLGAAVGVMTLSGADFYTSVGPGIKFGKGDFSIRYQYMGAGSGAMMFRIGLTF